MRSFNTINTTTAKPLIQPKKTLLPILQPQQIPSKSNLQQQKTAVQTQSLSLSSHQKFVVVIDDPKLPATIELDNVVKVSPFSLEITHINNELKTSPITQTVTVTKLKTDKKSVEKILNDNIKFIFIIISGTDSTGNSIVISSYKFSDCIITGHTPFETDSINGSIYESFTFSFANYIVDL